MKVLKWVLFVPYILVLSYIVFFARRRNVLIWHDELVNLIPIKLTVESFQSDAVNYWNFFSNLLGNIALFIPLPLFLISLFLLKNKFTIIFIGIFISLLIELVQFTWRIGVPDIDDVLLNTLGVVLGIILYKQFLSVSYAKIASL
ncbi:VanZ family protein [Hymenobacter sp. GOD-10R]|uniref:VanZ family protein n=1 Tax=Hymenobacter sp. GOD-10R TaxID=3093922 RepID=UPI002D784AFA|nr:VanZ family protein [Hymenobacter sp. GOD-10R]WRQ28048.1 VanZ family protein [Hymenobacter sp. GOD-10R]